MNPVVRWLIVLPTLLLLGALGTLGFAQELVSIPALRTHVTDQAGLLTPAQREQIAQQLAEYETRTGSQIAILLIPTTAPEAIEQYSIRVADAWKLGRKNVDDGVLLIVAKDNPKALHRLRIEAGRGVQGSLTDLQSKRILQEVIAPYFQHNDFNGGLQAGVQAIMALLDKEQLPAPPPGATDQASSGIGLGLGLLMALGVCLIIWQLRRQQGGNALDHGSWGRTAGVIIGSNLGSLLGGSAGGGGDSGSSASESGGGGSFDGGGASGDW